VSVALTTSRDHIPAHLLRDIDPWQLLMSAGTDAHGRASKFHHEFPRIFYATKLGFLGGVWVPRFAADMRNILQDTETFSSASYTGIAKMIGETWNLIPVETDPPMHTQYRALLNPLFSPKRMAALEPQGLDTVTSSLGFQELLRFYSIVNPIRTATKDATIGEANLHFKWTPAGAA